MANIFLECLFHDVKLQYAVPIISQQGEVRVHHHIQLHSDRNYSLSIYKDYTLVYLKLRHFGRLYLFWGITCPALCVQVAGRLHIELMRVSGAVPERLSGGDDSSENSSESSCFEVMDTNGEIVHMSKRLTCRVKESLDPNKDGCLGIVEYNSTTTTCLFAAGADQRGHRSAAQPVQLCLLSIHLLGARRAHCGPPHGQPRQSFPSKPRRPVHCPV